MTSKEKFDWIKENISIVDYASSIGFTPVRKGKYYSLKEHDSIIIDVGKNVYWQHSVPGYGSCIGEMGSVIDFAMKFCNMSFYEVVKEFEAGIPKESTQVSTKRERRIEEKQLILPKKDINMRKVFAYLIKTRHIKPDIVQFFVDNKMLYQDINGNCVFVSYDLNNGVVPVFACRRGTNTFKPFYGDVVGCDYSQCFYVENDSNVLVVTESVIDAMSVMSLVGEYKKYNYLALGGVGKWDAVKTYLKTGQIKEVINSTDNDQGGIACAQCICSYIRENYPNVRRRWNLPPKKYGKDWNEILKMKGM